MRAARSAKAPTGVHSITQSAPSTALAGSGSTQSAIPSSITRSSVFWVRALTTISAAMSPRWRAIRATEEPISPTPRSASRLKTGSAMGLPHEFRESIDNQPDFLSRSDRHPQAMRQSVAAHLAHDDPAGAQERIGGIRRPRSSPDRRGRNCPRWARPSDRPLRSRPPASDDTPHCARSLSPPIPVRPARRWRRPARRRRR